MRQRNYYFLLGIILLFLVSLTVDLAGTAGGFKVFGHGTPVKQGLDLTGGIRVLLQARNCKGASQDAMTSAIDVITKRVNAFGVSEPQVSQVGSCGVDVEVPDIKDPDQLRTTLGSTGLMVIYGMGSLAQLAQGAVFPYTNVKTYCGAAKASLPCIVANGNELDSGQIGVSTDNLGQPIVLFGVKGGAVGRLSDYTSANVGTGHMAIVLDGKVVSDPNIQGAITGGNGEINNIGTVDAATALSISLKYGALPIAFDIQASDQVSATLGPQYVRASIVAGAIGLGIVILFMLIYYRLPGLLADLALIVYATVIFAIFKLIPVTLTLAGIAGFILSIGMAVDANVLIFERLKEEIRAGKTLGAAIEAGFNRAWTSIRDSNISTMITCVVLYWFGQTFAAAVIVGFATTLFIGVLISMFTAVVVSRTFLRLIVGRGMQFNPALFGAGLEKVGRDDVVIRRSTQE